MDDSQPSTHRSAPVTALGYGFGWLLLSLSLTLVTRPMHLGPGFRNPLPYMALAAALAMIGRALRAWLA